MSTKPPNTPLRRSPWRTSCRTQARIAKRSLRWIDIDKIGAELAREHSDTTPENHTDAALQALVTTLRHFGDSPFPPNAMYLELIRAAWRDSISTNPPTQESTETWA